MGWWQFQQLGQYPHVLARGNSAEECGVASTWRPHWPIRQLKPILDTPDHSPTAKWLAPMTSFSTIMFSRRQPVSRSWIFQMALHGDHVP